MTKKFLYLNRCCNIYIFVDTLYSAVNPYQAYEGILHRLIRKMQVRDLKGITLKLVGFRNNHFIKKRDDNVAESQIINYFSMKVRDKTGSPHSFLIFCFLSHQALYGNSRIRLAWFEKPKLGQHYYPR